MNMSLEPHPFRITLTGSAQCVGLHADAPSKGFVTDLTIMADSANSGTVYVGNSDVEAPGVGWPVAAGDQYYPRITAGNGVNMEKFFIDGTADDVVYIMALVSQ